MGEDRFILAVVAKSKKGRRIIAEELAFGYRSELVKDALYGETTPIDLIMLSLLTERSARMDSSVSKCSSYLLAEVYGRWYGKPIYIGGDYAKRGSNTDVYEDISRDFGNADVIVVDISKAVAIALLEYIFCKSEQKALVKRLFEIALESYRLPNSDFCSAYGLYCGKIKHYIRVVNHIVGDRYELGVSGLQVLQN